MGDELEDRAAAVVEELRIGACPDGLEETLLTRLDDLDVGLRVDHPALLGGHVVPEGEDVDEPAELRQVAVHRLDVDVGDAVEEARRELRRGQQGHHERLHAHRPAGLLEDAATDDARADDGDVRGGPQLLRPAAHPGDDLGRVGLRPAIGIEGLEGGLRDGELDPVVVERPVLGHAHLASPAVPHRPVVPVVDDLDASHVRHGQLDHAGVRLEAHQDILGHVGQLLHLVVDGGILGGQSEVLAQREVGGLRDGCDGRRAEVDGDPVGLAVLE